MTDGDAPGCQNSEESLEAPLPPPPTRAKAGPVARMDTEAAVARITHVLRAESPDGAPLAWLTPRVFGDATKPDTDRDWVRRQCDRLGYTIKRPTALYAVPPDDEGEDDEDKEYDVVEAEPYYTWVFPRFGDDETGRDTAAENVLENSSKHSSVRRPATQRCRVRAEGVLSRRRALDTGLEWGTLLGAFAAKRKYHERSGGTPTATKFNTRSRATTSGDWIREAFAVAPSRGWRVGAIVTPTTAEKAGRFESLADAAASLTADVDLLKDKLKREVGLSCRPPMVVACEPSARGLPHAHIGVLGHDADAFSERSLHDYWWEKRGRGQQVDVTGIEYGDERWEWAGEAPADAGGCPPSAYVRRSADALVASASVSAAELQAVASAHRALGKMEIRPDVGFGDALDVDVAVDPAVVRTAAYLWATDLPAVTEPHDALTEGGA